MEKRNSQLEHGQPLEQVRCSKRIARASELGS